MANSTALRFPGEANWKPIYIVLWQDDTHVLPQAERFHDKSQAERAAAKRRDGRLRTDWLRV